MKKILAFVFPLLLAALLSLLIPEKPDAGVDKRLQLKRYQVASADELQRIFNELDYSWPPQDETLIPAIEVSSFPQDLVMVKDVKQKKALFFQTLLPIVLAENEKLADLRRHAKQFLDKGVSRLEEDERRWLDVVARQYEVKGRLDDVRMQRRLLTRLDEVPPALVLAQAANESAWGTSRFARLGNNLFGQWTYRQSQGIVPLGRPDGETYAVRAFTSIDASVRAYLHNLNTHPAYKELRRLRSDMRAAGQRLDAHVLATGLLAYSQRGEAYIEEIQAMIRVNRLMEVLSSVSLGRDDKAFTQLSAAVSTAG